MKKKLKSKQKKSNTITIKKVRIYWLYILLGALAAFLAFLFAPFWTALDENFVRWFHVQPIYNESGELIKEATVIFWKNWGNAALGFILAALIIVYVATIITRRLKKKNQHRIVRILTAIEFSIMVLLIVGCILLGVKAIAFFKYIQIVGLALWIRGFVETFAAYYYERKKNETDDYPVWYLLLNISFVTLGTLLFAFGFNAFRFDVDLILQWVFTCLLFIGGILLIIFGILSKPIRVEVPADDMSSTDVTDMEKIDQLPQKQEEKIDDGLLSAEEEEERVDLLPCGENKNDTEEKNKDDKNDQDDSDEVIDIKE